MVSQVSNVAPLTVLTTVPDDQAGWRFVAVDLANQNVLIAEWNVARGDWTQILNDVGYGNIALPAGDPVLGEILSNDPTDRKAVLIRAYMDDVFRYAFFAESRKDDYSDDLGRLVTFSGKGMESVAGDMKIRPFDHPLSPSVQTAWQYGSLENFVQNANLESDDVISNPSGADGNDDTGKVNGWTLKGSVDSAASVNDPVEAYTGDHYIAVDTSSHHSGIEQSIACEPGRVYHLQAFVKEDLALGQRYTLAVGGANDIAKTATYTNNFIFDNAVMAELDNVASTGNGCPGGASDGTWQVLDVEVTTGAEQTSLDVSVQHDHHPSCGDLDGTYPAFWLGDITIEGWGLGLEPFTAYAPASHESDSFQRVDDFAPPGLNYSIRINPTGAYAGIDQIIEVTPGGHYRASVQIYTTGFIALDTAKLEIRELDGVTLIGETVPTAYADGVWTTLNIDVDIPAGVEQITYRVTYSGPNDPAFLYVANFSLLPGEPPSTPGKILADLLTPIQARGTVDYLTYGTFDATFDSAGRNWTSPISLDINPGSSILDVLKRFVALGYEWMIVPDNYTEGGETGFTLLVYNSRSSDPLSGAGINWTSTDDAPVVLPGEGISSGSQRDQTRRPNVVYVHGLGGVWTEVQQQDFGVPVTGYDATIGRLEEHIDVADVSDPTTLSAFGEAFLNDELNREHGFRLKFERSTALRPYRDFGIGDSLYVDLPPSRPDPTHADPRRIRSLTVTVKGEGSGVVYLVDFDRVIRDDEAALLALIAQLAERSPTDTTGSGSGSVTASGGTVSIVENVIQQTTTTAVHGHAMSSLTGKALAGDVSGQVDAPITVNRVRGIPVDTTGATDGQALVYSDDTAGYAPGTVAAGGGGGAGDPLWTLDVDDALTALTAITSYSGTWSIDTTLKCVGQTSTQCRAFSDVVMGNVAQAIIEVEVEIPASGFTTSASHIRMGFGPANGAGAVNFGLRGDDLAYFEEDAALALATNIAYTIPAGGTWVTLRMVQNGDRFIGFIDGVQVGEINYSSLLAGADWSPYVVQYSTGAMTVRYRNLKAWSSNAFDETFVAATGGPPQDSWLANLFTRPSDETPHAYDDEFEDAAKDAAWVELVIAGTAVWTEKGGRLNVIVDDTGDSDASPILKPLDSLSFPLTIETAVTPTALAANYLMFGLIFSDGVTATDSCIVSMPFLYSAASQSFRAGTHQALTTNFGDIAYRESGGLMYQRLIWVTTNSFKYQWSMDGVNWITHTGSGSFTLTPTHFGLWVSTWTGATERLAAFEYFRVTEADLSV